jgi:ribosomal protein S12 methylthiotransferase
MAKNVGFISLGCDKNRVDTEIMLSILSKKGYNIVNDQADADLIIVNTCGFIEDAKLESIETIIEMSKEKEKGKCKAVIATGCMAQRYTDELLNEIPEIDAVVGTGNYRDICDIVERILSGEKKIIKVDNINCNLDFEDRILTTPKQFAYVKIAEGCSNNCTYCIIPKLRGKFRSRNMESIIEEVKQLGQMGVKEIILVAQDTTMYGIDIYGRKALSELLNELDRIESIEWIRIMYSYPEEIDDKLIETVANSKKICHYFDIPLQHVSSKILKLMNRRNTYEDTVYLIEKIRMKIPDAVKERLSL